MESQAQLSPQHRSQTPILQNFNTRKAAWCLGTSLRVYKRGDVSGREPTGGDQRHWRLNTKRQRQKHVHHWQQFTRAFFPGGRFPAKFGYQPIELELYPLAHAYAAKYVRVHLQHSGVYKDSRVAYRVIRVRVS